MLVGRYGPVGLEPPDEAGETMAKLMDLKERFAKDPAFREEYARAADEHALLEAMISACSRLS